jgi:hypothetical protein
MAKILCNGIFSLRRGDISVGTGNRLLANHRRNVIRFPAGIKDSSRKYSGPMESD